MSLLMAAVALQRWVGGCVCGRAPLLKCVTRTVRLKHLLYRSHTHGFSLVLDQGSSPGPGDPHGSAGFCFRLNISNRFR